jgi:hypothetical protein
MLFSDVADMYAKARGCRDGLKDERETLYANLYFDIANKALEKDPKTKITEEMKKNAIKINKKYVALSKSYLKQCLLEEEWKAVRDAMMHRTSMVKELCQLYVSQYYIKDYISKAKVKK